jgi:type I restriction enzyme S subunit
MKIVNLGEVARIYNGNSINERVKAKEYAQVLDGTPYIATKDIAYSFDVDYENGIKIPANKSAGFKVARKGSVLLCAEGGSAGRKMAIIDRDVFFVNKLFCFETNSELNSRFLFYYLQAPKFQSLFKDSITGLIGGVSLEKVRNLPIGIPNIKKQLEIVEKLDSTFSQISLSVSTTNESLERLVSCFDSFLNGILQEQITICGEKELVDVMDIARGGSPRPIEAFLTEAEDGINWIKISDATSSNKYITETVQKIKPEGASRSRIVHPGDFLLSNSMSFGRPYIMGTSGCIHDGWLVLSNTKGLLNQDYLYYVLGSKYIYEQFNRTAAGSTVRNLNISLAGQVKFPVPSLDSQKMIVSSLVIFETSINEMQESLRKKIAKLAELKDALLAEAFEVDIPSSGLAS